MKSPTRRTFAPFCPGKNANYVEVVWYVLSAKLSFQHLHSSDREGTFRSQESFRLFRAKEKIICQPENVSLFCGFFRFVKRINFLSTLCWAFSPPSSFGAMWKFVAFFLAAWCRVPDLSVSVMHVVRPRVSSCVHAPVICWDRKAINRRRRQNNCKLHKTACRCLLLLPNRKNDYFHERFFGKFN